MHLSVHVEEKNSPKVFDLAKKGCMIIGGETWKFLTSCDNISTTTSVSLCNIADAKLFIKGFVSDAV